MSAAQPDQPNLSQPNLSLCVIARDNADTIEACLAGIKPFADEMVVVDTGSVDNTPAICQTLGARVHFFPWCDDVSAARNEALRHARGRWIVWLDSDDVIDADNARKILAVAQRNDGPSVLGYLAQVHCPEPAEEDPERTTIVEHVRLIRNLPELQFEGRIHQQIMSSIVAAGGTVMRTDIVIRHTGYHSPEVVRQKLERNLRLLKMDVEDRPEDAASWLHLGMTHASLEQYAEAVRCLGYCIQYAERDNNELAKAYGQLARVYHRLGMHHAVWQIVEQGLARSPADPQLLFQRGLLARRWKRYSVAEAAYRQILATKHDDFCMGFDAGILSYKARHNLAGVYADQGKLVEAERLYRRVVEDAPGFRLGWRGLMEVLCEQGRTGEAAELVESLLSDTSLRDEGQRLRARLANWSDRTQSMN